MPIEPKGALDCPCCGESIYETLNWFKKACSTCPACAGELTADQFAVVITDLEQAMAANLEEMVHGQPSSSCCNKKSTCCQETT